MAPRRARTRSEVIVWNEIDRLIRVLRIIKETILTAGPRDRYLLDFQPQGIHSSVPRPPQVTAPFFFGDPNMNAFGSGMGHYNRARDREYARSHLGFLWGRGLGLQLYPQTPELYSDQEWLGTSWGTLQ